MLRNTVGGGWVSAFPEKSVTKVYSSTLLALRGGGWRSISRGKALCDVIITYSVRRIFVLSPNGGESLIPFLSPDLNADHLG